MIDRKRKMDMQRRVPLLLVPVYLCFAVTAADILKDLGNLPICAVSIQLVVRYLFEDMLTINLASLLHRSPRTMYS